MSAAEHGIPWGSQVLVTKRFSNLNFSHEIASHVLESVTIRDDSRPAASGSKVGA